MATANVGTYLPDPNDNRIFGLDLSGNQGNIDFNKTANPEGFPRVRFVACRTGISWAYKDAWFETYWKSLKEKMPSVKRIAYHVLYPSQPVIDQVNNMKSRFPNGFDGDAVVNDLELSQDQTPTKISESCYEFTNRIRDWSKKPAIIYSRFSWVETYMDYWSLKYVNWFRDQLWWMANYYGVNWLGIPILKEYPTEKMYVPERLNDFNVIIHQTGEKGDGYKVGTVSKQVDTDRWTKSNNEFYSLFGQEEIPVDPTQPELSDDEKLGRLWTAHPELH